MFSGCVVACCGVRAAASAFSLRRFQDKYAISYVVQGRRSLGSRRLNWISFGGQQSWHRYSISMRGAGAATRVIAGVVFQKFIEEQMQVLRLTTPRLKYAWGPVRSG